MDSGAMDMAPVKMNIIISMGMSIEKIMLVTSFSVARSNFPPEAGLFISYLFSPANSYSLSTALAIA